MGKGNLLVPTAQLIDFLKSVNKSLGSSLQVPVGSEHFSIKFKDKSMPRPRFLQRCDGKAPVDFDPYPIMTAEDLKAYNTAKEHQKATLEHSLNLMDDEFRHKQNKAKSAKKVKRLENMKGMLADAQVFLGLRPGLHSDSEVVFVCFDVEAIEIRPNQISEIGIAILDTREIQDVPSGPGGSGWWDIVKAYHLRTREYSGLVNFRYVQGCPDAFNFG